MATLWADIVNRAAGGPTTQELQLLESHLELTNLGDKIAEDPHAAATKAGAHSNASKWPYDSATMRLDQNICDKTRMTDERGLYFQRIWNYAKQLSQLSGRNRAKRIKHKDLINKDHFFKQDLADVKRPMAPRRNDIGSTVYTYCFSFAMFFVK